METEIKRKPVTAELKALAVGETATFPVEQRSSVMAIANKLAKDLMRSGWSVELADDFDNYEVSVTRTK